MTTQPPPENPVPLSGVIVRTMSEDLDFQTRRALEAAGINRVSLLQWVADPEAGTVTISKARDVG